MFALMAAGGDLGASVGPQLVGIITDTVSTANGVGTLATRWGMTTEQLGMKCGMLVGVLFSFLGLLVYLLMWRNKKTALKTEQLKSKGDDTNAS